MKINILKHSNPSRLPLLIIFVPIIITILLYLFSWLLLMISDPSQEVGFIDDLPSDTPYHRVVAHELGWYVAILWLLMFKIIAPLCAIIGTILLAVKVIIRNKKS